MHITFKYYLTFTLCFLSFQYSWAQKAKTTSHSLYKYDNKDYTVRIDSNSKKIQIGTQKKFIEYAFKVDSLHSDFHENGTLYNQRISPILSYRHKKSKSQKNQTPNIKVFSDTLKRKVKFIHEIHKDIFFVVVKFKSKKEEITKAIIERGERQLYRLSNIVDVLYALMIYKLFTLMPNPDVDDGNA